MPTAQQSNAADDDEEDELDLFMKGIEVNTKYINSLSSWIR